MYIFYYSVHIAYIVIYCMSLYKYTYIHVYINIYDMAKTNLAIGHHVAPYVSR